MDLTDSVAVVTGASSGIGRATAAALAAEGCSVTLAARREERLEELADELGRDRALPVPTDVSDPDQVVAMVEETRERFGPVDVLVNCAGIVNGGRFADLDLEDLHREVRVNLEGVMNATHAALPDMLEAGKGHVVAISSVNARVPAPTAAAYTATKFGVNGFCRALRRDVGDDGVRVTTLMPGPVVTEMRDWAEWDGRALDPEDVADAVVFVVSRPEHVSITDLTVDATDPVV